MKLLVVLIAFVLSACTNGLLRPVHEDKPTSAKETVQHGIDELNVAIIAAGQTLKTAATDGTVSTEEFESARSFLKTVQTHRNEAESLLKLGDISSADGKVRLANAALSELQKRLAKLRKGAQLERHNTADHRNDPFLWDPTLPVWFGT